MIRLKLLSRKGVTRLMGKIFYWIFGIATSLLILIPCLTGLIGDAGWSSLHLQPADLLLLVPLALAFGLPGFIWALSRNGHPPPMSEEKRRRSLEELQKCRRGKQSPAEIVRGFKRAPPVAASYKAPASPPLPLLPEPPLRSHLLLLAAAFVVSCGTGLFLTRGRFDGALPAGVVVLTLALYLPANLLLRRPWRASASSRGLSPNVLNGKHPIESSVLDLSKEFPFLNRRWG